MACNAMGYCGGLGAPGGVLAVDDVLGVCVEVQVGDRHVEKLGHSARRAEATNVSACAMVRMP